jgi:hypothetical protein
MNMKTFPLGRNKSKPDFRNYHLSDYILRGTFALGIVGYKCWDFLSFPLDQDDTPHCGGFVGADWGICLPVQDNYVNQDGHNFYYKCKVLDGEPGQENGTNIHSLARVLKNEGKINAYAFASSVEEIKWWILNRGPVIVGTDWTEDMFTPDANNRIHPTGAIAGGHAYLLTEWTKDDYIGIQNSWGSLWGNDPKQSGKAYISESDFKSLFLYDGEALAAIELNIPIKTNPWINFLEMLFKIIAGR